MLGFLRWWFRRRKRPPLIGGNAGGLQSWPYPWQHTKRVLERPADGIFGFVGNVPECVARDSPSFIRRAGHLEGVPTPVGCRAMVFLHCPNFRNQTCYLAAHGWYSEWRVSRGSFALAEEYLRGSSRRPIDLIHWDLPLPLFRSRGRLSFSDYPHRPGDTTIALPGLPSECRLCICRNLSGVDRTCRDYNIAAQYPCGRYFCGNCFLSYHRIRLPSVRISLLCCHLLEYKPRCPWTRN